MRNGMILTATKEIISANILKVEVGTNGYCGGDSGHGGVTYLKLSDLGGTGWDIKIDGKITGQPSTVELRFYGDCELDAFIDSLLFAANKLQQITTTKKVIERLG